VFECGTFSIGENKLKALGHEDPDPLGAGVAGYFFESDSPPSEKDCGG
jgi:hypothetical protein